MESSSGSGPKPGHQIPEWLLTPPAGQVTLIAKAGEGAAFPDYVEEALKKFEAELQQKQPEEPGQETWCGVRVDCDGMEVM
jgi:hypothetical protein